MGTMMTNTEQLDAIVRATGAPLDGIGVLSPTAPVSALWHVVTRADGLRVRVDYSPTATQGQKTTGDAAVMAADLTLPALATADTTALRNTASTLATTDPSPAYKALRAVVLVLIDEINALRGQVVAVVQTILDPPNIANGAGASSTPIPMAGVQFGDMIDVAAPYSLGGMTVTASVVAPASVVVRWENQTGAAVNLAFGTWTLCARRMTALPARTSAQALAAITVKLTSGGAD